MLVEMGAEGVDLILGKGLDCNPVLVLGSHGSSSFCRLLPAMMSKSAATCSHLATVRAIESLRVRSLGSLILTSFR